MEKDKLHKSNPADTAEFHSLDETDRLYQFIRAEKPYFRPGIRRSDQDIIWYVVPKLNNARIIAQSGAFLLFGLIPPNTTSSKSIEITQILIDKDRKSSLRKELADLGINQRTLFPEIDKAASYVVDQFS